MSKKDNQKALLNEATIRRFLKLAAVGDINSDRINEMSTTEEDTNTTEVNEDEIEEGMGMRDPAYDRDDDMGEEEPAMDDAPEGDMEMDMDAEPEPEMDLDMDAEPEAEASPELENAAEELLGMIVDFFKERGVQASMEADSDEEAPAEEEGELGMADDDVMEATEEVTEETETTTEGDIEESTDTEETIHEEEETATDTVEENSREEIVAEVARRVTKRLLKLASIKK